LAASRSRRLRRLLLAVLALDVALLAFAFACQVEDAGVNLGLWFMATISVLVIGLAVIGHLIVERQQGNAVGWIFLAVSVGFALTTLAYAWAGLSADHYANGLPGTTFAAWLSLWDGLPCLVTLIIFVPLLFPDGQLLSPRWRWVAAFAVVGILGNTIGSAFVAGPMTPTGIDNPLGIEVGHPAVDVIGGINAVAGLLIFTLALVALVLRYRRGSSVERLQLRWLMFPTAIAIVGLGAANLVPLGVVGDIGWIVGIAAVAAMPVAIGIAILRYNLYGIDVLLNRTAVYASVTGLLAAAFVIGNIVLQYGFESLTAQHSELLSGVFGVAIGLLFVPIRSRVRPVIDRLLPARGMLALLFTDIVGSTQTIVDIGDQRWRSLLGRYLATVRQELARHHGREVNTAGDAFFATFTRPQDAIEAAWAIRSAVRQLGLESRTGLHLGEVEMRGEQVSGLAVHTAARVMAAAGDGEVLVSDAMRDAIAAQEVSVVDRGRHELKGVPGDWQLYAVETAR